MLFDFLLNKIFYKKLNKIFCDLDNIVKNINEIGFYPIIKIKNHYITNIFLFYYLLKNSHLDKKYYLYSGYVLHYLSLFYENCINDIETSMPELNGLTAGEYHKRYPTMGAIVEGIYSRKPHYLYKEVSEYEVYLFYKVLKYFSKNHYYTIYEYLKKAVSYMDIYKRIKFYFEFLMLFFEK
jgi:hypothetical protein